MGFLSQLLHLVLGVGDVSWSESLLAEGLLVCVEQRALMSQAVAAAGPGVVFEPSDTTFLSWNCEWGWINIPLSCHAACWMPILIQSFIQFTSYRKVVVKMSFKRNKCDNVT